MRGGREGYKYPQKVIKTQSGSHYRDQRTPATPRRSTRETEASDKPVFFTLEIREVHRKKPPQEWPRVKEKEELMIGRKYVLVLRGSVNGASSNDISLERQMYPQGVSIDGTIELHLQLPPEVRLPPEMLKDVKNGALPYTLTYQDAKHLEKIIHFTLLPNVPTQKIVFYLKYLEHGRIFPDELGQRSVNVQGSYNPEDRQLLEQCQINASLPAHVALLWIDALGPFSSEREQWLKLRGWCQRGKLLEEKTLINTEASVSITKLREGSGSEGVKKGSDNIGFKKDPKAIIDTLSYFSRTFSPGTIGWLQQISRKGADREQPCLIVVDNTTLEIPWEMLELEPKRSASDELKPEQKQYTYLGAVTQIARWLPFRCFARGRQLRVKKKIHLGKIISYVDPGLGDAKTEAEREALQRSGSQTYQTLEALKSRMSQPLPDVGLAYIGCHGRDGNKLVDAGKHTIELQKPSSQLRAIHLETLYAATDPRLTVFVNACEGARVIRDGLLDRSSFVESFLTHCAGGFIGPLAPVDIQNASQIASDLLANISSTQETSIAEALRGLRERAVQLLQSIWELPENQKRKELYQVLDTFMYVYYGNPLAHLRLLDNPL